MTLFQILFWLFIAVVIFLFIGIKAPGRLKRIIVLKPFEFAVIFRFGNFDRIAGPGGPVVLWNPLSYLYTRVDTRESYRQFDLNAIFADGVEAPVKVYAASRTPPSKEDVFAWALGNDDTVRIAILTTLPQAELRNVLGNISLMDAVGHPMQFNPDNLNRYTSPRGRTHSSLGLSEVDIPDNISEQMAQAAEARIAAQGIEATTDAFIRAKKEGVDQRVIDWQKLQVDRQFAEKPGTQLVKVEGGGGMEGFMGFLTALFKKNGDD